MLHNFTSTLASSSSLAPGDLQETFVGHSNSVRSCCFSPDGHFFLADFRRTLKLYETATRKVMHTLEGHFSDDGCSCFSPDGQQILGVDGQSLKLWNAKSGLLTHTLYGHSDDVSCCCFNGDGTQVLSGSLDCDMILWDTTTGRRLQKFIGACAVPDSFI
jgi:WD40 repeat protein